MRKAYTNILKIIVLFVLAEVVACKPTPYPDFPAGDLRITFKVEYDGEPYVMGYDRWDYNGHPLQIDEFSFYISNLALVKKVGGDRHELSEVELIKLGELNTPQLVSNGININKFLIPEGEYEGISFSFGVPLELNGKTFKPGKYAGDHPLNHEEMVKPGKGYKFLVFSGYTDAQLDGRLNDIIDYEVFGDNLFLNERVYRVPIEISELRTEKIEVVIDIKDFLEGSQPPPIDVIQQSKTTSQNLSLLGSKLMKNLRTTLSINH